jgi:hypothetical protein
MSVGICGIRSYDIDERSHARPPCRLTLFGSGAQSYSWCMRPRILLFLSGFIVLGVSLGAGLVLATKTASEVGGERNWFCNGPCHIDYVHVYLWAAAFILVGGSILGLALLALGSYGWPHLGLRVRSHLPRRALKVSKMQMAVLVFESILLAGGVYLMLEPPSLVRTCAHHGPRASATGQCPVDCGTPAFQAFNSVGTGITTAVQCHGKARFRAFVGIGLTVIGPAGMVVAAWDLPRRRRLNASSLAGP